MTDLGLVDHLKWISKVLTEALVAAQPTSLQIEAKIYITGPSGLTPECREFSYEPGSTHSSSPASPSSEIDAKLPIYDAFHITHGRPSMKKILQEEISCALGPVSVDGKLCAVFGYADKMLMTNGLQLLAPRAYRSLYRDQVVNIL
jgi:hypothetical protein